MKKLKKQLVQLRKKSAPADGFKSALWAELDYEFDKLYPRPSFSFAKFIMVPATSMAVMALLGAGTFAYASPSVNSNHVLYPAKITLEKVEGIFYHSPEAKKKYFAKILDRRVAETQLLIEQTKQYAYVDLDYISEEYGKALMAGEKSDNASEAIAYLQTSNVRYLHVMREVIIDEIDSLTAEEVVGVITALENRGMTVTSVPVKDKSNPENENNKQLPFVSMDQNHIVIPINISETKQTEGEIKVEMITDKLDEVRRKIIESELNEGEKRALLAEFEQRLLQKYSEIEPELTNISGTTEQNTSSTASFKSNFIKN